MTEGMGLGKKERAGLVALAAGMPVIYAAVAATVWKPQLGEHMSSFVMWTVMFVGGICGIHITQHGMTDRAQMENTPDAPPTPGEGAT